ncbi:MAG: FAD-dependent oxidoreductase [Halioglobus sp.]|nr:FAD-dependent oxidoreductase [Halioglobus sp.]
MTRQSRAASSPGPGGERFPLLGSPLRIGTMELRNRMVMSPMTTAYCNDDQTPSERLIRYFEERAKGGVGLITTELITVDETHRYMHRSMTLGHDRYIDAHRRLADRIHAHGAKVQPQISHTGPESVAPMFGGPQPLGPSVNVAPVWGWASRPLELDELPAIAEQYGEAARRAREAGYDGIELHAAHCYNLLGSFLSPLRNKRTDDYSAFKAETRTRFIREVLGEIRARAGSDFPVTLSISGFERTPGGRAIDDTQRLAPELVAAGVDCFRVSGGISDALVSMMVGRSEFGDAHNAPQAEAIKQVVDVPVMLVGRIHDPRVGEQMLAAGVADLIAMARPLLADPELPAKVVSGRARRIRRCISCENCIDSMQTADNLGCAVNPLSGRELELPIPAGNRRVVVIGGGTAGLEAARLAAQAGHRVLLLERQRRLGGSLLLASTVHSDNESFLHWLLDEIGRLGVEVRTGVEATVESVRALRPDSVIVATGARLHTPPIDGIDAAHVLTGALLRQVVAGRLDDNEARRLSPWQRYLVSALVPRLEPWLTPSVLRRATRWWMPVGREVVIVGADLAAVELAEFLARRGRRVHLVGTGKRIAPEVGKKRRQEHMDRLDTLRVTVNTGVDVLRVEGEAVVIEVAGRERRVRGDTVLVAGDPVADTSFADALGDAGLEVQAIGDCTGLGLIAGATASAAEAVARLGSAAPATTAGWRETTNLATAFTEDTAMRIVSGALLTRPIVAHRGLA